MSPLYLCSTEYHSVLWAFSWSKENKALSRNKAQPLLEEVHAFPEPTPVALGLLVVLIDQILNWLIATGQAHLHLTLIHFQYT